jgi:16S rRNA (cytidine1402-2'-O)-methyltransferase
MPLVSDPGYRLVNEAVAEGIAVTCCPGPSAVLTGLALSGLASDRFCFFGFFPQKQGERQRLLQEIGGSRATSIFFESPHRIVEALRAIAAGLPGRSVAAARELTKLHEEVLRGSPGDIAATLASRPAVKGEFTLLIGPANEDVPASESDIEQAITDALSRMPASKAAAEVAKQLGLARSDVYDRILARGR